LRKYAIGLDTAGSKVAFWYGGNVPSADAAAWCKSPPENSRSAQIPIHSAGEDDWFTIEAEVNRKPLKMLLDTGTAYCTVNPSLVKPLGLRQIGRTIVEEIGTSETLDVDLAESIRFGPFSADFPVINVESSDDDKVDGILGTEALGSGRFLLDMPASTLYATRTGPTSGNPLERRLMAAGIEVFASIGPRLMTLVQPNSLAAQKGVESGDELVSIGDLSVSELLADASHKMTAEDTGKLFGLAVKVLKGELSIKIKQADGGLVILALPAVH
jgi:hypothetical protein